MGFTSDWVTPNVERWREVLGHLVGRAEVTMAEIGSYEGRSALWFVDNILTGPNASIWCFDPWPGDRRTENLFDKNTAAARDGREHPAKLRKVKGDVWDLAKLPPGYFDAIYVDGDHRAFAAMTDAIVSWRQLRVGGILIFDDYGIGAVEVPHHGPALGIDGFLQAAAGRYKVLAKKYQVILQKVSD